MLFGGPRRAERRGYDGTICGRIIRDSACFFPVVWRGRLQEAFDQDTIARMRELKGSYVSENI